MDNAKPRIQFICSGKRLLYICWIVECDGNEYFDIIKTNFEVDQQEQLSVAFNAVMEQIFEKFDLVPRKPCGVMVGKDINVPRWIPVTERLPEKQSRRIVGLWSTRYTMPSGTELTCPECGMAAFDPLTVDGHCPHCGSVME